MRLRRQDRVLDAPSDEGQFTPAIDLARAIVDSRGDEIEAMEALLVRS